MLRRLFGCSFGLHHRDGRKAYYTSDSIARAPCKYCGTKLEKAPDGSWHPVNSAAHKAAAHGAAVHGVNDGEPAAEI